jgi:hypothetical protein
VDIKLVEYFVQVLSATGLHISQAAAHGRERFGFVTVAETKHRDVNVGSHQHIFALLARDRKRPP